MNTNTQSKQSPTDQEISARAYEIWEESGNKHGFDAEHWHQAKTELSAPHSSQSVLPAAASVKNDSAQAEKSTANDGNFQRSMKPGKKGNSRSVFSS